MADRYQRSRNDNSQRDYDDEHSRQSEQFQSEPARQSGDYPYEDDYQVMPRERGSASERTMRGGSGQDYRDDRFSDVRRGYGQSGRGQYDPDSRAYRNRERGRSDTDHDYFRGDDYGGTNFSGQSGGFAGGGSMGNSHYARRGYSRYDGDSDERGFFDRAGDEIASWFGDEDAERRRERDYRGHGPKNYERSNERILEDACDHLTNDRLVDARDISVTVDNREITLDGTVKSRREKRRAEDCVHDISGVNHVQNNLRIQQTDMSGERNTGAGKTA